MFSLLSRKSQLKWAVHLGPDPFCGTQKVNLWGSQIYNLFLKNTEYLPKTGRLCGIKLMLLKQMYIVFLFRAILSYIRCPSDYLLQQDDASGIESK